MVFSCILALLLGEDCLYSAHCLRGVNGSYCNEQNKTCECDEDYLKVDDNCTVIERK